MKKLLLVLLFGVFLISMASAIEPSFLVKEYDFFDVKVSCENQGALCSGSATCNITINYPNSTTLIDNQNMTDLNNGYFSYPLTDTQTSPSGFYSARASCIDGANSAATTFYYEVTPTGSEQRSIFNNPVALILIFLSLVIVIVGIYYRVPAIGFLGAVLMLLSGMYILIYGFGNVANLYTRASGVTIIAIGFFFMFVSGYEWFRNDEY